MNQIMSEKPPMAAPPKAAIEVQIVENLRRVYSEKLEEAVPDRFLKLLEQLRNQDGVRDDEIRD